MKYPRIPRVARGYPQDAANFDRGKRSGCPRICRRSTVQECELGSEGAFRSKTCKLPRFHLAAISPVEKTRFQEKIYAFMNNLVYEASDTFSMSLNSIRARRAKFEKLITFLEIWLIAAWKMYYGVKLPEIPRVFP